MIKIPDGLVKCGTCGEYKGEVMKKDLSPVSVFDEENKEKSDGRIGVSCICEGIACPKCKINKIHRPISNTYHEEDNTVWHNPWFWGMRACESCRLKDSPGHGGGMSWPRLWHWKIENSNGGEELLKLLRVGSQLLDVANRDGAVGKFIVARWKAYLNEQQKDS